MKKRRPTNNLVLVTGGAGFIGTNVVNNLTRHGYRVRVMDLLIPPTHNGKLPVWFNKKADFIKGDVRKRADWERALRGASYVIHLAVYADVHPEYSVFIDTNVKSVTLLYEIIEEKRLPIKKVLIASSQSVYGEGHYRCPRHGEFLAKPRGANDLNKGRWEVLCPIDRKVAKPVAEHENDALDPITLYGVTKLAAEKAALLLGKTLGIPTVLFRYSIAHGPYQSFRNFYSGALRAFAVEGLAGVRIETQEDGGQMRDFVHAEDVAEAHCVALRNPKADFQVFNVGSGRVTRVRELAETVAKVVKSPYPPVSEGAFRLMTPRHSIMDVSKLKKLGWRPKHTLYDNVSDYISWARGFPEAFRHMRSAYKKMAKAGYLMKVKTKGK